jgi:hypothetical protein
MGYLDTGSISLARHRPISCINNGTAAGTRSSHVFCGGAGVAVGTYGPFERGPGQPAQWRMFTAREAISATVSNEASDWMAINVFAIGVKGRVSVGLKAVALVSDR